MDAAEHTGEKGNPEQTVRYIITRPCLSEGCLRLLKYLQPAFPADGELTLRDNRGEEFAVAVDAQRGRLTGFDALYRAHNMGVNDVLMLQRTSEREYTVACVVKPHARSQSSAAERPAPPMTEKRVVILATPHVREVRMERVSAEPAKPQETRAESAESKDAPAVQEHTATPTPPDALRASARPSGTAGGTSSPSSDLISTPTQAVVTARADRTAVRPTPVLSPASAPVSTSTPGPSRAAVPTPAVQVNALTARLQQHPAPVAALLNTAPIQFHFAPPRSAVATPATSGAVTGAAQTNRALNTTEPVVARAAPVPVPAASPAVAPAPSEVAATAVQTLETTVAAPPPSVTVTPPGRQQNPEDQLAALARLTGYSCEHLGSGVVRLRAELGSHGYSVLIATTPQALTTPAWNESCDYMALLTPEDQRPQGIPRFTYAALEALLEHARLAPLTPIDLRGYWNTGSFDQESVESVAELVSAHLAQRGSFSHVLATLAQQPAHSLVQLPRLAERLGSGVNTAELQSILETLTRPPFLALTPLPGGQYYLRSDVRELLQEFGDYAEGMRRRLRPAPLAATGR